MLVLIVGLVIFLGVHSTRIVAEDSRSALIARKGEPMWKGLYTIASVIGLALTVWGYSLARQQPVSLWVSALWTRHVASLLTMVAFILVAAAYIPANHFKATIGHPMLAGTALWAVGHLISNGTLADLLLFGSFLVWAIAGFISGRSRDRRMGTRYPPGTARGTFITVVVGTLAGAIFAFLLHGPLIGVRPLG